MQTKFQPGSLVRLRNREWVVMPSDDEELLIIKPLGGADDETTGIYLPLQLKDELPESTTFPYPKVEDLGNYSTAKILFNAARLSFRNVSGPFRCMGRLSFRPRSYQVVPLIMSLKQDVIRLLIADDVGVGKTIEALMIARELIDRGEIKRFAVVCLPHLCDQWQQELKDKFSIEAEIIRSSTAARLDRMFPGDESIFRRIPYQVISIDFIKSDKRRSIFISDCPELIIVDEAHTCTKPAGASVKQQQRYYLIHDIAKKPDQHLLLLTATPHSGKEGEFKSLIGLLKPEYETMDIVNADQAKRKAAAENIIIRRRADVEQWHETTTFPKRDSAEIEYELADDYKSIFFELLKFVRGIDTSDLKTSSRKKFKYFAILSLLRGVMSSPLAGMEMLTRKAKQLAEDESDQLDEISLNPIHDSDESDSDALPINLLGKMELKSSEVKILSDISERLSTVKDNKAETALKVVKDWIKEGYNPLIFCRFIATAKYLGDYLKDKLPKGIDLLVITGEMVDEERRERIQEFGKSKNKKLLVSTDCLSEGINLQQHFTAVLHYDLPWNPNRLEQREGRIDRFGQTAKEVKAYMLWGKDNPIDSVVLNVLLKKAKQIRKQTGISVPFPEDSQGIMDSLLNAVLLNPNALKIEDQLLLDLQVDEIAEKETAVTKAYEEAAERNKLTRSIFAQHSIKVNEIEQDLKETDEAIGDPEAVKLFVLDAILNLGAQIKEHKEGFILYTTNLPNIFKPIFNSKDQILISFFSPTPVGFEYIGRNHPFVEQLCQYILNISLLKNGREPVGARASVITTNEVDEKTTILQLRVRNIISDKTKSHELVAEEMILWGYKGNFEEKKHLSHEEAKELLEKIHPTIDSTKQRQENVFNKELESLSGLEDNFNEIVKERSQKLIDAHERFSKLVGGSKYKMVEPVLPPDLLGLYVLLPVVKG